MTISKRTRYGFRCLIDMAMQDAGEPAALNRLGERNGISVQYLEQIFAMLRKAGLVKSIKGAQGGYLLNLPASRITAAMIWKALEGDYAIAPEESTAEEGRLIAETFQQCVIGELNRRVDGVLGQITLEDLARDCIMRNEAEMNMYYI